MERWVAVDRSFIAQVTFSTLYVLLLNEQRKAFRTPKQESFSGKNVREK